MDLTLTPWRPDLCCRDLSQVPFDKLAERQIVNICLDVDNTLARRDSWQIEPQLLETLQGALKAGFIHKLCLLSNIGWGSRRKRRVQQMAAQLGTEYYFAARFWEHKPRSLPFRRALHMMEAQPAQTAIIGDQLFTDIAGGNKVGLYTILVRPLGPDHWSTRLSGRRLREARILRALGLEGT